MKAGQLRHEIVIEQETRVSDGQGGFVSQGWTTFISAWASIESTAARKAFEVARLYPTASHQVEMRFLDGVTSRMRVRYGARTFLIQGVINPSERGVNLKLACEEQPAA